MTERLTIEELKKQLIGEVPCPVCLYIGKPLRCQNQHGGLFYKCPNCNQFGQHDRQTRKSYRRRLFDLITSKNCTRQQQGLPLMSVPEIASRGDEEAERMLAQVDAGLLTRQCQEAIQPNIDDALKVRAKDWDRRERMRQ